MVSMFEFPKQGFKRVKKNQATNQTVKPKIKPKYLITKNVLPVSKHTHTHGEGMFERIQMNLKSQIL